MDADLAALESPLPPPPLAPSPGAARETDTAGLDRAVAELGDHARAFARTPVREKIALLEALLPRFLEIAPEQVALGCKAKGVDPASRFAGEEWLGGPMPVLMNIRLLIEELSEIAARGRPERPRHLKRRADGRVEVPITPRRRLDRAQLAGMTTSVLFEEGVSPEDVEREQASFYKLESPEGAVSLILGAGNVASITPMDALFKLFVEGKTALIKMSPVNDYLGPLFERAFAPLIERGFLRIVYGGGDAGAHLAAHSGVGDIHLTGSAATHDLIVWGPPGPERQRRLAAGDPLITKPVSSELGNVSPVIVAPYLYRADDLSFMARNVASQVTNNASFNCNAAKMLVLPQGWAQRTMFLDLLQKTLTEVPPRRAYYPGALDRYQKLTRGRRLLLRGSEGDLSGETLPWTIVPELDPKAPDEPLFSTEPFCGLLSEVSLGSEDPVHFFAEATAFCNDRLWGTLSAEILAPPSLSEDPATSAALEASIRDLRYGAVAVNQWPAMIYALSALPWGGHPSSSLADIQSGRGFVHNTRMFERLDKAILRGPLCAAPKPPFFCDNLRMLELGERLSSFAAGPTLFGFLRVAASALRG